MKTLFPLLALLASCAQGPALVQRPDGSLIATTGTRWLNKTAQRDAVVTLPNGARLEEHVTAEDSTKALSVIGNSQLMGKLTGSASTISKEAVNQ